MKYISLLFLFLMSKLQNVHTKCCDVCTDDTEKYYSIPFFHQNNCGESCINPDDFIKYKIFEPFLTKANTSYPCEDMGFIFYIDTETHGFGPVQIDLDLYSNNLEYYI